jgi:predicted nucleic-acid-binding Zn-ribbon protein
MLAAKVRMAMPDASGRLTDADNDIIQQWWNGRWKAPVTCPVCKTTEWTIAPHVVDVNRYAADASASDTVTYPHIVVTCKRCAHAMFFNAAQIGVTATYKPHPQPGSGVGVSNLFGGTGGILGGAPLGSGPLGGFGSLGGLGSLSDPTKKKDR